MCLFSELIQAVITTAPTSTHHTSSESGSCQSSGTTDCATKQFIAAPHFSMHLDEKREPRPRLVREGSHCMMQALEMWLGPDTDQTQKNWKNFASKYKVPNFKLLHLACAFPGEKVQKMFTTMPEFVKYTEDQLVADLKEFQRTDVLEYLRDANLLSDHCMK